MSCQILRRCADDTRIGGQPPGDQAGLGLCGAADGQIHPLMHQVDHGIRQGQVHDDLGIALHEAHQQWHYLQFSQCVGTRETNAPLECTTALGDLLLHIAQPLLQLPCLRGIELTRFTQAHPPSGANQ